MINDQVDTALNAWLIELAKKWNWSPQYTADHLDDYDQEIPNRNTSYPKLANLLRRNDWTILEFKRIATQCYTLNGRNIAIPLNTMLKKEQDAWLVITDLLKPLPKNNPSMVKRIDEFIHLAVELGFKRSPIKPDNPAAAYVASVLLSALYPWKFVDFRTQRWNKFAELLAYPKPPQDASYGEKVIWAGEFAEEISQTKTFKEYWSHLGEAFWVIAGLCWHGPEPEKPIYVDEGFSEGQVIERKHKYRERSSQVVDEAKQLAYERDKLLRCEVCGFSFQEKYGERGKRYIEAHHKLPLSELTEKTRTKVEDLVLVCSNCHVMIHRRNPTFSISDLREILR